MTEGNKSADGDNVTEPDNVSETAKISVLIVDDQLLTRMGLRILIERCPDMDIVGEASNGQEALNLTKQLMPSVVVMDVGMPVMDGIDATKQIKSLVPETSVLILTT